MSWLSFLAIYFVTWFLSLFIVLPLGVKRSESPEEGNEVGAPEHPYMWRKALGASIIAFVVTGIVWLGVSDGWISFRPT